VEGIVSDGGKTDKPQPKTVERAPSLARKIADFQGEAPTGVQGMAATHAHKQKYFRGVEYRFSEGVHGARTRRTDPRARQTRAERTSHAEAGR
jgi:hypothetical protein